MRCHDFTKNVINCSCF